MSMARCTKQVAGGVVGSFSDGALSIIIVQPLHHSILIARLCHASCELFSMVEQNMISFGVGIKTNYLPEALL